MAFTYNDLVAQVKTAKSEYTNTELPAVLISYPEFAIEADIDIDSMYSLQAYIKKASYADKRTVFEKLGFKVLYMTLSIVKLGHMVRDNANGVSLEQQFLDNKRNVFIVGIDNCYDSLFFLVEYPVNDDPLAEYTVDREELQRQKERQEKIRSLFKKSRRSE